MKIANVYPGSTTELRILRNKNGDDVLQFRQINLTNNYVGAWRDVPIVEDVPVEEHKDS